MEALSQPAPALLARAPPVTSLSGLRWAQRWSSIVDRAVRREWEAAGPPQGTSLWAVGGYGRGELSPGSDLDLMLLLGRDASADGVADFAQRFVARLWDLRWTPAWRVRSRSELDATQLPASEVAALLDARRLAGVRHRWDLGPRSRWAEPFIAQKRAEQAARRAKQGGTVFLLAPNVKQGEGGLRDLETARWVAHARFGAGGLRELLRRSVLSPAEVAQLEEAQSELLRIRHALHLVAGRKEDRLSFELQPEVAKHLGERQVETLMGAYYAAARTVRHFSDVLLARADEARAPARPQEARRLDAFSVVGGHLSFGLGRQELARNPELLVRIFELAEAEGVPLHSHARTQVRELSAVLAEARGERRVVDAFRRVLTRPGSTGDALWEMHALGALGAVLPEFGRLTALHQADRYHVYTVDIHTLFAVRRLMRLRAGDAREVSPDVRREMQALGDVLPLFLGMLLHDCAKGMGGGHSEKGEGLAQGAAARLGLTERQTALVQFLVARHLELSHTAQHRDLGDPALVAEFAAACGTRERLRALLLLTYADIASVAPGTWNAWKERLCLQLFRAAEAQLTGARAEEMPAQMAARLPPRYAASVSVAEARQHARLLRRRGARPVLGCLSRANGFDTLSVTAEDRPGLLATLTSVLAAHGIRVLRARIFSTVDGQALDVFEVQGPQSQLVERSRWKAARADLAAALEGRLSARRLLEARRASSWAGRFAPPVPVQVSVGPGKSAQECVVDVVAGDRRGLLADVAQALSEEGLEISVALVSTEAHRAIDAFYVHARDGRGWTAATRASLAERLAVHLGGHGTA